MKKIIQIAFLIFISACILLSVLKFNKNGTVNETENRNLAGKPQLIVNGNINKNLFADCDSYFNDRFGGRNRLIKFSHFFDYSILKKRKMNELALEGKDGWLFYIRKDDGDNLSDFYKKNLLNNTQLQELRKKIKGMADWFSSNNIKFVFVIGPNKHCIYPEKYPSKRPAGLTRADQIVDIFNELNIPCIYPRDYLLKCKQHGDTPLYYETDTHWNNLGAYHAFTLIQEKIKDFFPESNFPEIKYEITVNKVMNHGDIMPMLGISQAKSTLVEMNPESGSFSDYYVYEKNEGTNGVETINKSQMLPKAIVFRDSFSSALIPFLSTMFSEAEYHWKRFFSSEKEYVISQKPDIVICECVERSLDYLLNIDI